MNDSNYQELMLAIRNLELQLQHVKDLAQTALPQGEWLTTGQFARYTGLKPKTVSNYAGKGRLKQVKKAQNGQYLIHISELKQYNKPL